MNDILKLCVFLALLCLVSGFCLGLVYDITKQPIEETKQNILRNSLTIVLPQADHFSEEKVKKMADGRKLIYYDGCSSGGKVIGYAIIGEKQGYQSLIRVLVGITPQGDIQGIDVLEQAETPGLGALIDEVKVDDTLWSRIALLFEGRKEQSRPQRPWFQEQYDGLTVNDLRVIKPPYKGKGIHALTGATITSRALTDAVKDAIEQFVKGEKGVAGG